jgi:protein translocase SecG subunit
MRAERRIVFRLRFLPPRSPQARSRQTIASPPREVSMIPVLSVLLWITFFASALLLIIVILLQEPKGGGLAEAFGGLGASTFGVKSSGTNRFTFTVFAVFLFSALGIHALKRGPRIVQPEPEKQEQPADEQGGGAPASPIKLEGVGQDGNPIKIETGQGGKVEVGGQPGGQSPQPAGEDPQPAGGGNESGGGNEGGDNK